MSVYDQAYKAYADSQKNNFWDAWGIVANPMTINELKAECLEHIVVFNGSEQAIEKLFGLVVIPCDLCDIANIYIVDERLGRTILEQSERINNE